MSFGRITVDLDEIGHGTVLLNGVDQAKYATSVTTRSQVGRPTVVEIEYIAQTGLDVTGEVRHLVSLGPLLGTGATLRAAIEGILGQLDE